jgi:hypothetical protein
MDASMVIRTDVISIEAIVVLPGEATGEVHRLPPEDQIALAVIHVALPEEEVPRHPPTSGADPLVVDPCRRVTAILHDLDLVLAVTVIVVAHPLRTTRLRRTILAQYRHIPQTKKIVSKKRILPMP